MATVSEIVERAFKFIENPDWEFHEALKLYLAPEIAPKLDMHPDDHRAIGTRINENGEIEQQLICIYKNCPEHPTKTSDH